MNALTKETGSLWCAKYEQAGVARECSISDRGARHLPVARVRMRSALRKVTYVSGLAGVVAIVLGCVVSGLAYEGRTGEGYSPLNHFVSELGDAPYAAAAWAFNGGLFVGSLLLTVFMLGLAAHMQGWFRYLFGIAGLVTGVSGALVGLLPMSADLDAHFAAAMTFFNVGLATTMLFSLYVLFSRQDTFSKWMALPGGITALSFFSLLYLVEPLVPEGQRDKPIAEVLETLLWNRPDVWQTAIVEWVVVLAVLGWVVSVALCLRRTCLRT